MYDLYYNHYPNNILQYIKYITTSTQINGRRYDNSHIKGDQVQPCYMISFWPASKTKICFDQFFPIKKIHNTGSYRRPDDRKTIKTCSMARFRWFDESVIMSKYSQSKWVLIGDVCHVSVSDRFEQVGSPPTGWAAKKVERWGENWKPCRCKHLHTIINDWVKRDDIFLERTPRALWHTHIHEACLAIVDFLYGCDSVSKFAFVVQYKNMLKGNIFPSAAMSTPLAPTSWN